jgi:choline-glycine betaine transporter
VRALLYCLRQSIITEPKPGAIAIELSDDSKPEDIVRALKDAFEELIAENHARRQLQAAVIEADALQENDAVINYAGNITNANTSQMVAISATVAAAVAVGGMHCAPVMTTALFTATAAANAAVMADSETTGMIVTNAKDAVKNACRAIANITPDVALVTGAAALTATAAVVTAYTAPFVFTGIAAVSAAGTAATRIRKWRTSQQIIADGQEAMRAIEDSQPSRRRGLPPGQERDEAPKRQRRH